MKCCTLELEAVALPWSAAPPQTQHPQAPPWDPGGHSSVFCAKRTPRHLGERRRTGSQHPCHRRALYKMFQGTHQGYQGKALASILEGAAQAHISMSTPTAKLWRVSRKKDSLLPATKTKPVALKLSTGGEARDVSNPRDCSDPHTLSW